MDNILFRTDMAVERRDIYKKANKQDEKQHTHKGA